MPHRPYAGMKEMDRKIKANPDLDGEVTPFKQDLQKDNVCRRNLETVHGF